MTVDLKALLPGKSRENSVNFGDIFLGILHQNLKCIEVINDDSPIPYLRSDGFYNHIPVHYDVTDEQFRTLLEDNPLVIAKYSLPGENDIVKASDFNICGDTLSSSKGEKAKVLRREVLEITPTGSPDARCNTPYISFSDSIPGIDVPYFREIQMSYRFKRLGLSSDSRVSDVPEGVKFVLPNAKRPLLGFGSDRSLKSLLFEEPQCSVPVLQTQLQTAIELEWATIPLYLTSLFSIKSNENKDIASRVHSIAIQEMLHFAQAANLLISVGGVPIINGSTAPTYPRKGLPGGVLEGLYIPLTKLTTNQTYHTFMGVEIPNNSSAVNPPLINNLFTIGAFYNETLSCIEQLGDDIFKHPSGEQVQFDFGSSGTLYNVTNVSTAQDAINEIVAQGEGETPLNPDQIDADGYAHFYQFEEIVCGKELIKQPGDEYYAYQGADIPLNTDGVYNMIPNPNKHTIIPNTDCYNVTAEFNKGYVSMIESLAYAFEVVNSQTINAAVSKMIQLAQLATPVYETPYMNGSPFTCGPVWDMDFLTK